MIGKSTTNSLSNNMNVYLQYIISTPICTLIILMFIFVVNSKCNFSYVYMKGLNFFTIIVVGNSI